MTDKLYLRATGFIWGDAASEAVSQGVAVAVAGGPGACLGFEVIEAGSTRHFASAADIAKSTDRQIGERLARITGPRAGIADLNWRAPVVMGILNVTPDSFSDGGAFIGGASAVAHGTRMAAEGADIIDIGGESTRPGAEPVDEAEELRRVLPVISGLAALGKPLSIDTRKAGVMDRAIAAGARIINDVSALTHEPGSLDMAAQLGCPVVLMHAQGDPRTMQDEPCYDDVLLEVYDYLEERIRRAKAAGIPRHRLIADPGIGFGKTAAHNLALLRGIGLFHGLGVPLLLGASRKRFIGTLTGEADPKRRGAGSIGIALAAAAQGVQLFRVHDVSETAHALATWAASR